MTKKNIMIALLVLLGLMIPALAGDVQQYWLCQPVQPGQGAGWCPVSLAYPQPVIGSNGSSTLTMNQVSVTSSGVQITPATSGILASKIICNQGATPVYLGPSTVTTSNSGAVIGGTNNPQCWDFTHFPGAIYGIVSSTSQTVGYVYY